MRQIWMGVISARMDRRTYAACTAIYLAVYFFMLREFSAVAVSLALPPLWMFLLAAPRLRDIGWNPWWSLLPFGVGFMSGAIGAIAPTTTAAGNLIVGLLSAGMMIGLALKRGKRKGRFEVFD